MANRIEQVGGVWADSAPDVPVTPTPGVTYVKSDLLVSELEAAWQYKQKADSAIFNEVLRRLTTLMNYLDVEGVLPYCPTTQYVVGSLAMGSNGLLYRAKTSPLGYDPVTSAPNWEKMPTRAEIDSLSYSISGLTNSINSVSYSLANHKNLRTNPHSVTAAQTGALTSYTLKGYFDTLFSANGYTKLPNGLMFQWGERQVGDDRSLAITWPAPFSVLCLQAVASRGGSFNTDTDAGVGIYSLTANGATLRNGLWSTATIRFFAIGY